LRICLVSAALPEVPCGIGDYTHHLATALAGLGAEPIVVTTAQPGLRTGQVYETRPIATRWRLADVARIARAVDRTKPDLVHIQFPGAGYGRGFGVTSLPWALLAAHPRRPRAITFHEFDRLSRRHRLRVAVGALPCRLVIAPGEALARSASKYLGWRPRTRIVDVPLASNLIPAAAADQRAESFRRERGEIVVGYLGFMRPDKGLETLIEAFAVVREAHSARLVFAGDSGPETEYVELIRALVHGAGLDDDTLFTGPLPRPDLSAALLGFDVCVLPFRDGLTPNRGSYAAAVAHGIPVVTTSPDGPGLDIGTNTLFAEPGDVAGLAEAILRHAVSPRLRPSQTIWAEWTAIAERHLELYGELLEE
jgi:glycosyltransferase involved in cell wall biosynthesis